MTQNNYDELLLTSYQHSYIFEKATLLKGIINNPAPVFDIVQGNDDVQFTNYNAITSHLKAEIHFSMFHALESMFALIFALIKQPDNVWVWLATYRFPKFNEMIAEIAKADISVVSERDEFETIRILFFKNCPDEFVEQIQVKEAIQIISKILILCANEMLDKNEYNSYKHGLRLISGDLRFNLVNEQEGIERTVDIVPGFVYLNTKNQESPRIVPKHYSFERSYKIIKICWQLTSLMINQRRVEYLDTLSCDIETIDFSKIDIMDIFGYPDYSYAFE